jgi:hypothetical protein
MFENLLQLLSRHLRKAESDLTALARVGITR